MAVSGAPLLDGAEIAQLAEETGLREDQIDARRPLADYQIVSHSYFDALDLPVVDGRAFGFDSLSTAPFLFPAKWSEARLILRTGFFRCRIRSLGAPLFVGPYAVRCSGDSLALAGREDFQRVLSTDAKRYPVESGVALWGEYEHFDEPPPEGPQSFHGEVRTILEDWGYIQKGTGDQ